MFSQRTQASNVGRRSGTADTQRQVAGIKKARAMTEDNLGGTNARADGVWKRRMPQGRNLGEPGFMATIVGIFSRYASCHGTGHGYVEAVQGEGGAQVDGSSGTTKTFRACRNTSWRKA
jgi:hypothetical protein